MVYGWEDYEFWLSVIALGRTVVQIDEHLFHYRVSSDSMVRTKEKWQKVEMFARIYRRHKDLFEQNIEVWLEELLEHREPYYQSKLYIDSGNGFCEKDSVSRKIVVGTHRVRFDLSSYNSIKQLRFDPVDRCCCISIQEIKALSNKHTNVIDLELLASNADYQKGQSLMFSDNDPNITIDGSALAPNVETLEITFTILSIGEQALKDIVGYGKTISDSPPVSQGNILKWLGLK